MKLQKVSVENFRCFTSFTLDLGGDSVFLIGENGCGKSALLSAIARGLGSFEAFVEPDFADLSKPIVIVATLGDVTSGDQALFSDWIRYDVVPPVIEVGVRAAFDDGSDVLDVVFGSPRTSWKKRATREQRAALAPLWLPASRQPTKELHFANARTLASELLRGLSIDVALTAALNESTKIGDQVANNRQLAKNSRVPRRILV